MSPEELERGSELIVVGELVASSEKGAFGEILVSEVFKGGSVARITLGGHSELRHSGMIVHQTGKQGLWFLRRASEAQDSVYFADHPQRFEADRDEITDWKERLRQ